MIVSYTLAVDWSLVDGYMSRVSRNDGRLMLDQDYLQWTPLVHSDDDEDDDDANNVQVCCRFV